jgi:hypothetical protein
MAPEVKALFLANSGSPLVKAILKAAALLDAARSRPDAAGSGITGCSESVADVFYDSGQASVLSGVRLYGACEVSPALTRSS